MSQITEPGHIRGEVIPGSKTSILTHNTGLSFNAMNAVNIATLLIF